MLISQKASECIVNFTSNLTSEYDNWRNNIEKGTVFGPLCTLYTNVNDITSSHYWTTFDSAVRQIYQNYVKKCTV